MHAFYDANALISRRLRRERDQTTITVRESPLIYTVVIRERNTAVIWSVTVTLEELLGVESTSARKRGPKSKLERQFEKIRQLPKTRQQFIGKLLDEMLSGKG